MTLTLELPTPLGDELEEEAGRAGVSARDHATILLYVVTALLTGEDSTPFQDAVKRFIAHHALDVGRVTAVLEELVALCAAPSGGGPAAPELHARLRSWRNGHVHHPPADRLPVTSGGEANGRSMRRSALGRYAHIAGTSEDFAHQKQAEIDREQRKRA